MAGVGGLERDVGAGVREADDEDGARAELGRVAVVVRVQLPDRRIELGGEGRDVGLPERPGRDDDLACGKAFAVRGRHDEAAVDRLDAIDARPTPDGQVEPSGVRLEVVGHLATCRPVGRRRGEAHAGERVVAGWAVEPERVPAVPPVVADPRVGVEDRERQPALREVIAGRQARLSSADDDRVDLLRVSSVHRRPPCRCIVRVRRRPDRPVAITGRYRRRGRARIGGTTQTARRDRMGTSIRRGRARTRTLSPLPGWTRRAW